MNMPKNVSCLLLIALAIGICSGYSFDKGNNTLLFASIFVGFIFLVAAFILLEKAQDEEYGKKVDEF